MITPREAIARITLLLSKQIEDEVFENWTPDDYAFYQRAREAFVIGGAEAVENLSGDRWLQVAVVTDDRGEAFLTGALRERVQDWLAKDNIQAFFFMRKSPGVRLRFFGRALSLDFQAELFAFLDGEKERGAIHEWSPGVYDAESYQFGGEAGLALMHLHATYDSLTTLWLLERQKRDALTADLPLYSLFLIGDLIRNVTEGVWEAWDVWENMRLAQRVIDDGDLESDALEQLRADTDERRNQLLGTLTASAEFVARLDQEEQSMIEKYFSDNAAWAARYREVVANGNLRYGIRKILPFYIVFHWNRLGFDLDDQLVLVFQMRRALDPKIAR